MKEAKATLLLQPFEGIGHHPVNLLVVGAGAEQCAQHADARAFQGCAVEKRCIGPGNLADTQRGYGIVWIVARHHV